LQTVQVGVLSLHSSLERSNREFACPQESVAVTCSVNGTVLEWAQLDGNSIGTLQSVGDGFSQVINCTRGAGMARVSGALEVIDRDSDFLIYNSTMVLTPSPDCVSINVTCRSGSGPEMSTILKIAGESL
jgi:hypothetical protein